VYYASGGTQVATWFLDEVRAAGVAPGRVALAQ